MNSLLVLVARLPSIVTKEEILKVSYSSQYVRHKEFKKHKQLLIDRQQMVRWNGLTER
jgi:hypothetical protein